MQTSSNTELMWGLGLTGSDAAALRQYAGQGFVLHNWPQEGLPTPEDMRAETPLLIWIPAHVWAAMPEAAKAVYREWETPLRILILGETQSMTAEEILEQGFLTTVQSPLTKDMVLDVLNRAKELASLYGDIISMTKEILLERELLARKTDQLSFLNRFLTRASESLDVKTILTRAREDIDLVLPLRGLHAIFWQESGDGLVADLFVTPEAAVEYREMWVHYLLENAQKTTGMSVTNYDMTSLDEEAAGEFTSVSSSSFEGLPSTEETLLMPLTTGLRTFGHLVLVSPRMDTLAKDQAQSVKAAITHLALALKNALLYREAQFKAEFDGLTRINNRQGFDRRLAEETSRHKRYQQPMSLLMIDLDHFKSINDTFGHEAGDMVLKEVGRTLGDNLRITDFPARYGGEEFAVILPHTPAENAWILAQRLRGRIASKIFHFRGTSFQVTASIGVSSIDMEVGGQEDELLHRADKALYQAKANGRNMVCTDRPDNPLLASQM